MEATQEGVSSNVDSFKIERFLALGYTDLEALFAVDEHIDWHSVQNLLEAGCGREIALEILR
jgi:hypothetical protein